MLLTIPLLTLSQWWKWIRRVGELFQRAKNSSKWVPTSSKMSYFPCTSCKVLCNSCTSPTCFLQQGFRMKGTGGGFMTLKTREMHRGLTIVPAPIFAVDLPPPVAAPATMCTACGTPPNLAEGALFLRGLRHTPLESVRSCTGGKRCQKMHHYKGEYQKHESREDTSLPSLTFPVAPRSQDCVLVGIPASMTFAH